MIIFIVAAIVTIVAWLLAQPAIGRNPAAWSFETFARVIGAVILALFCAYSFVNLNFLEADANVRLLLGAVFGSLVFLLVRQRHPAPMAHTEPAAAGDQGPWWARSVSLMALALIALPVVALLAPHGELDLGFVQSVKTPFVEAQFTRSETNLRLDLESEPQLFFQPDRNGLREVIDFARNEIIYLHAKGNDEGANAAAAALKFIVMVLQPAAKCAGWAATDFYGDTMFIRPDLLDVSAKLMRGITIASKPAADDKIGALRRWQDKELIPALNTLTTKLASIQVDRRSDVCDSIAWEGDLRETILHPAVLHAASMFFLWAGTPKSVLNIINISAVRSKNSSEFYPGLLTIKGFAQRWSSADAVDYLDTWYDGITSLQERRNVLKIDCDKTPSQIELSSAQIYSPLRDLEDNKPPKNCSKVSADECDRKVAYGFFTFAGYQLMNNFVYESARELITKRTLNDMTKILNRALKIGENMMKFVDDDGINKQSCFFMQTLNVDGGITDITTSYPNRWYATFLDSYGSILLASALASEPIDKDEVEQQAANMFVRAIRSAYASQQPLSGAFLATLEKHRSQARRALGLPGE